MNMGLTFTAISPAVINEDSFIDSADLHGSLKRLACAKARTVADTRPDALIIGADTLVVKDHHILGKPRDRGDARGMLEILSGSSHQVLTGVALVCGADFFSASAVACTDVFFRTITGAEIEAYLLHDEFRDKAGAYAIQGRAMIFIDRIAGCYYNVVGLPVSETITLLSAWMKGLKTPHE
jgi:septum formation protein